MTFSRKYYGSALKKVTRDLALRSGYAILLLMRWTCFLTGFFLLLLLPAHAGHTPPKVFLRINIQTTGEGQSSLEASPITLPPNGERILIRTLPEATEQDLVDVQQDASGTVHLLFNHEGQVALSAVTGENQGRILVVTLNGFVIYAPVIDEQITNGELDLPRPLEPAVLELLQQTAQKNVRKAAKS
jgi:hypothetical protein